MESLDTESEKHRGVKRSEVIAREASCKVQTESRPGGLAEATLKTLYSRKLHTTTAGQAAEHTGALEHPPTHAAAAVRFVFVSGDIHHTQIWSYQKPLNQRYERQKVSPMIQRFELGLLKRGTSTRTK